MADLQITWAFSNMLDACGEAFDIGQIRGYLEVHARVVELVAHGEGQGWPPQFMSGVLGARHGTLHGEHSYYIGRDPGEPNHVAVETPFDQGPAAELYLAMVEAGRQPGRLVAATAIAAEVAEAEEARDEEDAQYDADQAEYEADHAAWAEDDGDPDNEPEAPDPVDSANVDGHMYVLTDVLATFGITLEEVGR